MDIITSRSNVRIKEIRALRTAKGRRRTGRTLVEGPTLVTELEASALVPRTVLAVDPDDVGFGGAATEVLLVTDDVLASVADTETPQSPIAVIDVPKSAPVRRHRSIVLVDIADPGNVGTIVRTARAFDWDVLTTGSTADPWAPKALRAAAGATFHVPPRRVEDPVAECRAIGLSPVALVVDGGDPPAMLAEPIALLVGSESHGLPPVITTASDGAWTIPMPGGTESLNAAIAAGIAMAISSSA